MDLGNLGNLISYASFIIAVATVAGLSLQRGRVTTLRETVEDQSRRIEDLTSERIEDKATIARQASDIAALQRIVTGEVHWTAISDLLEDHHKAATENWSETKDLLGDIRDDLRRLQ